MCPSDRRYQPGMMLYWQRTWHRSADQIQGSPLRSYSLSEKSRYSHCERCQNHPTSRDKNDHRVTLLIITYIVHKPVKRLTNAIPTMNRPRGSVISGMTS